MVSKVYLVEEVVKVLEGKIPKTAVYRMIASKKLKATKIGKRWLITEENLNKFLEGGIGDDEE